MPGVSLQQIDDDTDLDGERIDIPARLGWVAQMARTTAAPAHRCSRAALARQLSEQGRPTNESQLTKVEHGDRRGDLYDAYERALHLQPGQLRTPVDTMCRTFSYAPDDLGDRPPLDMQELSRDYERLANGPRDGDTWVRWARLLNRPDALAFPLSLLDPLLDVLVSETGRACGVGYLNRYEALTRLRSGPYHASVLRAAERAAADPDLQVLIDLFSAVSDHATPEAEDWLTRCLHDPRPQVVRGACIGLANLASVAGWVEADWARLLPHVEAATTSALTDEAHDALVNLRAAFPGNRQQVAPRGPASAADVALTAGKVSTNPAWRLAERLAERVTEAEDIPGQPILARLLFEVIFDPREHRAVPAYHLLSSLPFLERVVTVLLDLAAADESPLSTRVLGRVAQMRTGLAPEPLFRIAQSSDPAREAWRLVALAYAGHPPSPGSVTPLLASAGRPRRLAVLTLGLSDHPDLDLLCRDPDDELAGAARWWSRHGGLVRDRTTEDHLLHR